MIADIKLRLARSALADQKRREIEAAFAHLAPVFEHLGVAVTKKDVRDPTWTLKHPGTPIMTVKADGSIAIEEGRRR